MYNTTKLIKWWHIREKWEAGKEGGKIVGDRGRAANARGLHARGASSQFHTGLPLAAGAAGAGCRTRGASGSRGARPSFARTLSGSARAGNGGRLPGERGREHSR